MHVLGLQVHGKALRVGIRVCSIRFAWIAVIKFRVYM